MQVYDNMDYFKDHLTLRPSEISKVRFSRSEATTTPMSMLPSSGSAMASEKPATDPEIDSS